MQSEAAASSNEAYTLVAKAINAFATEREKGRKQRKRGESSDSEDEPDKHYDCTGSLAKYGLHNIPNTHLPKDKEMEKWAKKASTSFKTRKSFLLQEPVTAFQATWADGKN